MAHFGRNISMPESALWVHMMTATILIDIGCNLTIAPRKVHTHYVTLQRK